MTNFNQFFDHLITKYNPGSLDRKNSYGYIWETQVCIWLLQNDPYWSTQFKPQSIMSTSEWGYGILDKENIANHKIDTADNYGIDLVAETYSGEIWGIQAKCYTSPIPTDKIQPFVSGLHKTWTNVNNPEITKEFNKGLLLITNSIQSRIMRNNLKNDSKEIVIYGPDQFEKIDNIDWFESLSIESQPVIQKKSPLPHQLEALKNIKKGFLNSDLGKVVMACGTGKTLVGLWAAEQLESNRTLVIVPSLSLINQVAIEWLSNCNKPISPLFVCSDESIKDNVDQFIDDVSSIGFSVTTNVNEILYYNQTAPFEHQVIFCTYQSAKRIKEAHENGLKEFDLVIADEAHHTVGEINDPFSIVLHKDLIKSRKKLFMTATPRYLSKAWSSRNRNMGIEPLSMDNEYYYGPYFYILNFGKAIKQNLLSDYRVVINIVTNSEMQKLIESRKLIMHNESGIETDALTISMMAGFINAIEKYNLTHVITFHNTISQAKKMSDGLNQLFPVLYKNYNADECMIKHIASRGMTISERTRRLSQFKNADQGINILTNARCLTEGVDIRAVDGIVFFEPKKSKIDILQSVGRAIRKSNPPKTGTVLLPIVIDENEDPSTALDNSNFRYIWNVLEAMKEHDDILYDELNQIRANVGKLGGFKGDLPERISIDVSENVSDYYIDSIKTKLILETTTTWDENFGILLKYKEEFGNTSVPSKYIYEVNGKKIKLGMFVNNIRADYNRLTDSRNKNYLQLNSLTKEQIDRLNSIEFNWRVRDREIFTWDEMYEKLQEFIEEFGHTYVPTEFLTHDGYKLGQWAQSNRLNRNDIVTKEREDKLLEIGFACKGNCSLRIHFLLDQIAKFENIYHHTNIPLGYISPDIDPFNSPPFKETEKKYRLGEIIYRFRYATANREKRYILTKEQKEKFEQFDISKQDVSFVNIEEANIEFLKKADKAKLLNIYKFDNSIGVQNFITQFLQSIDEKQREIIIQRNGLDDLRIKTLEEIGDLYGLTRERIRQIEKKTLESLHNFFITEGCRSYSIDLKNIMVSEYPWKIIISGAAFSNTINDFCKKYILNSMEEFILYLNTGQSLPINANQYDLLINHFDFFIDDPDRLKFINRKPKQRYYNPHLPISNNDNESGKYQEAILNNQKELITPIKILNFTARTHNALRRGGIETIYDLVQKNQDELLQLKSLGNKSLDEIYEKLKTSNNPLVYEWCSRRNNEHN